MIDASPARDTVRVVCRVNRPFPLEASPRAEAVTSPT
jgi:hypothetical protein